MSAPYDVFISHCGQDSKRDFAIMLRKELQVHTGIRCFFDERDLHPGDNAPKEMLDAMASARIGVVILSSGFFVREWCMKELQTFVNRKNLLPIFFGVGPDQLGACAEGAAAACAKFSKLGMTPEEYKRVVKAVGSFTGVRPEALDGFWDRCIEKVRSAVQQRLGILDGGPSLSSGTLLVGIDVHLAKLKHLLGLALPVSQGEAGIAEGSLPNFSTVKREPTLVGIWGMGGVGKTTVAASLFDDPQVRQAFGNKRVWVEVNKNPSREQICRMQEQILDTLCNLGSDLKAHIHNPREGAAEIRRRLADAKVLLFLDNVWDDEGRRDVLSPDWLGPGSCIVITTRSKETIGEGQVYELDRLDPETALRLFSWHAFSRRRAPCAKLEELACSAVELCGGLPLAITVIGAWAARETNGHDEEDAIAWWQHTLIPDLENSNLNELSEGQKVIDLLRLSYRGLRVDLKQSFVLVAGMWHGVIKSFDTQALVIKLAAAVYGNKAGATRSAERALEQLTQNSLLKQVVWKRHKSKIRTVVVHDLLIQLGVVLAGEEAEFGRCVGEMSAPNLLTDGKHWRHLVMDASTGLELPASFFNGGIGLKSVVLRGGPLPALYPGLADCRLLSLIDLRSEEEGGAVQVANLSGLANLLSLDLVRCQSLVEVQGLGGLTALQSLDLSQNLGLTGIEGVGNLKQLRRLDLSWCESLPSIGDLSDLGCLQSLDVRGCTSLTALGGLGGLTGSFVVNGCKSLKVLKLFDHPLGLQALAVNECEKLTSLEGLGGLIGLQALTVTHCKLLHGLEGLKELANLAKLSLKSCGSLEVLENLSALTSLQTLRVEGCGSLTALAGLGGLVNLKRLDVIECGALTALGGLGGLLGMKELKVNCCRSVKALENLVALAGLESLCITRCKSLTALRGLQGLSALRTLSVTHCRSLRILEGLEGLASLQVVDLSGCWSVTGLEGLAELVARSRGMRVTGCDSLVALALQSRQASDAATAVGATSADAAAPEPPSVGQPSSARCNAPGIEGLAIMNADKEGQLKDGPEEAVSPGTRESLECLLDSFQSSWWSSTIF